MDLGLYQHFLEDYVKEALERSDGTASGISGYLWQKSVSGMLVAHKKEKQKALDEARRAFDEHRHWPVEITLSHLGLKDLKKSG